MVHSMMDNVIILPARTYNKNQKYLLEHICSLIDFLEEKKSCITISPNWRSLAVASWRQVCPKCHGLDKEMSLLCHI